MGSVFLTEQDALQKPYPPSAAACRTPASDPQTSPLFLSRYLCLCLFLCLSVARSLSVSLSLRSQRSLPAGAPLCAMAAGGRASRTLSPLLSLPVPCFLCRWPLTRARVGCPSQGSGVTCEGERPGEREAGVLWFTGAWWRGGMTDVKILMMRSQNQCTSAAAGAPQSRAADRDRGFESCDHAAGPG